MPNEIEPNSAGSSPGEDTPPSRWRANVERNNRWLAACLVLMACLGCFMCASLTGLAAALRSNSVIASAQATRTASLPLNQATATVNPRDATATAIAEWPLILLDTFDSNTHDWATVNINNEYGKASLTIVEGKYQWEIEPSQQAEFFMPSFPSLMPVSDFQASIETTQLGGSSDILYGLAFRKDASDNFYFFNLNRKGQYTFQVFYKGRWVNVESWTQPASILNDGANTISINAVGSHFTFYVNGHYIGEADDDRIANGIVGLLVLAPSGEEDKVSFTYDNFELRVPLIEAAQIPAATAAGDLVATYEAAPLVLADDFIGNSHGWSTQDEENAYVTARLTLADGSYRIWVSTPRGVFLPQLPLSQAPTDFYYTIDVQQISGPAEAGYGVVLLGQDGSTVYYFAINNERIIFVSRFQAEEWSTLLVKAPHPAVRPGEVNRLGVLAQGARLIFFVNDVYIGELQETLWRAGKAGLGVDLEKEGDTAEFVFTRYRVYALATPTPTQTTTFTPSPTPLPTLTPTDSPTPGPTLTPTVSPTPTPTFTPTLRPTPTLEPARLVATYAAAPLALSDDFQNYSYNWPTGEAVVNYSHVNRQIDAGVYQWEIASGGGGVIWAEPLVPRTLDDFYAAVDIQQIQGNDYTQHGLRLQCVGTISYRYFMIRRSGQYAIYLTGDNDSQRNYLAEWLDSASIRTENPNRLAILASQSRYFFFINDRLVDTVQLNCAWGNAIALAISPPTFDPSRFEFDNFELRAP